MSENRRSGSEFSIDTIVSFCKKNVKYISAGVLTVAIVVVLAVVATGNKGGDKASKQPDTKQEETDKKDNQGEEQDDEKDADGKKDQEESHPEIKELVSTYYNSYAAGDLDKLTELTKFLSDMEKDYITMMNEHVASYNNVSCIVEDGAEEGDYIVCVAYDMTFEDMKEALPGSNIFYIQTNKDGELYINNRYSSFNREIKEQKTKKKILNLIKEFENGDKVQKLQEEVQENYDKIVSKDEKLEKKVNDVAEAISEWKQSYKPAEEEPEEEQAPEEQQPEEEQAPEEPEQEQPSDDGGNESDGASDTNDNASGGLNYVPDGKVLTATGGYNVRVSMNESAELVGTTAVGDTITVILSYAEGWTKVEWNGTTGYIRTDLLLAN